MQPRLRTLVWKEMPPCVRRFAIGWSRRLLYAEMFLGRLYVSWTKSPTWNFVAIAGTIGIVLTILLFLTPWDAEADAEASSTQKIAQKSRPAWELDSRLVAIRTEQEPPYPVEFLFARDSRSVGKPSSVASERRSRRRTRDAAEDQPLMPLFESEPAEPVFAVRPRKPRDREPERDFDWTASEEPQPPDLLFESEIVPPSRRRRRESIETEMTWTGRTQPPDAQIKLRRSRFDIDDPWQPYDVARVAHEDTFGSDPFGDSLAVPASHADRPLGNPWEPLAIPDAASETADVQLELSWDRTPSRRRRDPQLHVRNLGSDPIARIDVISGPLPKTKLSVPATFLTQALSDLTPGSDESVPLPQRVVSVLITAFVGGTTRVHPAVAERREPIREPMEARPIPVRVRAKPQASVRAPDRPHLSMTTGKPGRLPQDNMVSVPIRVLNDGNVPLYDIVILAKIPATLEHEHGRNVHYRLGQLQPGEQRTATLLLTPLEAGSTTVPLEVTDGKRLASAAGEAGIHVAEDELAERKDSRRASRSMSERASRRK